MAQHDNRPLFVFDFGARESEETLRTRLLLEAEICLSTAGRPQRQFLDELRAYIIKNKGSDAKIYPILRIIHRYMNVTPTDFRDLINLIGINKALEFIDGIRPPSEVWHTINTLRAEGADPAYIAEFWNKILDALERGEERESFFAGVCYDYLYTYRGLRPGYDQRLLTRR